MAVEQDGPRGLAGLEGQEAERCGNLGAVVDGSVAVDDHQGVVGNPLSLNDGSDHQGFLAFRFRVGNGVQQGRPAGLTDPNHDLPGIEAIVVLTGDTQGGIAGECDDGVASYRRTRIDPDGRGRALDETVVFGRASKAAGRQRPAWLRRSNARHEQQECRRERRDGGAEPRSGRGGTGDSEETWHAGETGTGRRPTGERAILRSGAARRRVCAANGDVQGRQQRGKLRHPPFDGSTPGGNRQPWSRPAGAPAEAAPGRQPRHGMVSTGTGTRPS